MKLMENVADMLDDMPLMDVVMACVSATALCIRELPADQREAGRRNAHALLDAMLAEWTPET